MKDWQNASGGTSCGEKCHGWTFLSTCRVSTWQRIVKLVLAGQAVGRAQEEVFYRWFRQWVGVEVGRGQVLRRLYDKVAKMRKKTDPAKKRLLKKHRWGGPQETAMWVEFQVRREALKGMGIDGVADYFARQ